MCLPLLGGETRAGHTKNNQTIETLKQEPLFLKSAPANLGGMREAHKNADQLYCTWKLLLFCLTKALA